MPDVELLVGFTSLAVVAGLFRGFAGFGSGLLMAPILMVFIPPVVAVPSMLMIALAASARLVPNVWGQWDIKRVAILAGAATVSIPFGEYLLLLVPAELMQRIVAAIVLALVAVMASGWRYDGELRWPVLVPAGLASGLLSGMGGVGGPPVVLVNMADSEPARARANLVLYFVVAQLVAVSGFAVGGVIDARSLWFAGVAVIPFVAAIHFGTLLFRPDRAQSWRVVSLVILAFSGLVGLLVDPLH